MGRAAWHLSVTPGSVTLDRAFTALGDPAGDVPHLFDFGVIPEVAAEVVGYARSDLRRPGLHFLVDAGAGTLDVAGFVLHEDQGENLYPILSASVRPHGSLALLRARREAAANAKGGEPPPTPRAPRRFRLFT
ncbi:hypothetical protein H8E07_15835, partial [bacterium]|nr:hypothetical protein [bacterium]